MSKRTDLRTSEAEWRRTSPQAPKRTRAHKRTNPILSALTRTWRFICR